MMNDAISYLNFNGNDFTNFISFVKSMNSKDKSKGTKNILLHVENNTLIGRAIDDSSNYIEYYIELYDNSNAIIDYISASIEDLATLIKCANGDKFTIRKQYDHYEFNVVGNGWLPFKVLESNLNKFKLEGIETEIGKINSVKLRNAISSVLGYTQEYTHARDKYIQFSKSQMVVTSRLSSVVTADEFVEMTLHRDDAAMLKSLLKDSFDVTVYNVSSSVDYLMFAGPKFKLRTIAVGIEPNGIKYMDNIKNYITIDCDELYKIVTVAEEYSASKKIVGLSIKNGKLQTNVKNVLASRHVSIINSTVIGDVTDTSKEADVSAHNLLKTLKLFQDKHSRSINIYITDELVKNNSIIIFDNTTQAIINICNK